MACNVSKLVAAVKLYTLSSDGFPIYFVTMRSNSIGSVENLQAYGFFIVLLH